MKKTTLADFLVEAIELAFHAHGSQLRKIGVDKDMPYMIHPLRVMARLPEMARVVGVLHDVLEDTTATLEGNTLTYGDFQVELADLQRDALIAVTQNEGEAYFDYIHRVRNANPIARWVKLADLGDNLDTLPKGHSLRKRYELALKILNNA